jgi:hypothetical protein
LSDVKKLLEKFKLPIAILIAEEMARELGDEIVKKIPKATTKTIDRKEFTISYSYDLLTSNVRGRLKEMVIRAYKPFGLFISVDERIRVNRDFEELKSISQFSEVIDAFQDEEGYYVVVVRDVSWMKEFTATLTVKGDLKVKDLWIVWDEHLTL